MNALSINYNFKKVHKNEKTKGKSTYGGNRVKTVVYCVVF